MTSNKSSEFISNVPSVILCYKYKQNTHKPKIELHL
jgi:hypothetical protein